MMLLLNLGGRHLPTALTPEQDKFFQNPWIRRGLLFVVIFVATRNVLTAFWLSLGIILVVGYLTNETSALYLFGPPKPATPPVAPPLGLTPEEQDFLKRLQDKAARVQPVTSDTPSTSDETSAEDEVLVSNYVSNMRQIQAITGVY